MCVLKSKGTVGIVGLYRRIEKEEVCPVLRRISISREKIDRGSSLELAVEHLGSERLEELSTLLGKKRNTEALERLRRCRKAQAIGQCVRAHRPDYVVTGIAGDQPPRAGEHARLMIVQPHV